MYNLNQLYNVYNLVFQLFQTQGLLTYAKVYTVPSIVKDTFCMVDFLLKNLTHDLKN